MSFNTDLSTLMNSDSTLNSLVSSRIYSNNLPDNLNPDNDAIVYNSRLTENEDCLDDYSILEYYDLFVVVLSQNSANLDTISAAIRDLLDDYSDTNIKDVLFISNTQTLDGEKERYVRSLEYRIIYK